MSNLKKGKKKSSTINLYININDASKANLNIEIDNGFMAALSGASKMDIYGKA